MRAAVLLVALLVPACAAGASTPPDVEVAAPEPSPTPAAPAHAAPSCERVFTPAPELRLDALAAVERWSNATGCSVTVGEGGTPILLVDDLPRPDGSQAPGATDVDRSAIRVHARAVSRARVIMHELGHGLWGEHTDTMGVLSLHEGHTDWIDAAALETVCAVTPCGAFRPEVP